MGRLLRAAFGVVGFCGCAYLAGYFFTAGKIDRENDTGMIRTAKDKAKEVNESVHGKEEPTFEPVPEPA